MNKQSFTYPFIKDPSKLKPTLHAKRRMAQRNVSLADIHFVLQYGQRHHRAGAIFFFLRGQDISEGRQLNQEYSRLEGTVVVLNRERSRILTVYRNRKSGLQHIKQKPRYGYNQYSDGIVLGIGRSQQRKC
jgi:hypothetical protein